jgi:hypothetical protein
MDNIIMGKTKADILSKMGGTEKVAYLSELTASLKEQVDVLSASNEALEVLARETRSRLPQEKL